MTEDKYIGTTINGYEIIGIDENVHKDHKYYLGIIINVCACAKQAHLN